MSTTKLTPAQQQYKDIKAKYQDFLVLFRMGDFYELFYDDAKTAHHILDITLTARDKDGPNPIPMAGIPYHALDKYLPKLMQAGYKVAIAEQMGEVVPGKVVQREVTTIVTPGTYVEHVEQQTNLVAVRWGGLPGAFHLAWGDTSLGSYSTKSVTGIAEVIDHLGTIHAKEVLLAPDIPEKQQLFEHIHAHMHISCSWHELPKDVDATLAHILQVDKLTGYGEALTEGRKQAAAVLLSYVMEVQPYALQTIHRIRYDLPEGQVFLDTTTIRNLEIFASSYQGNKKYSLYEVINCTSTAMGSRVLMDRLLRPTYIQQELERRLGDITRYVNDQQTAQHLHLTLRVLPDIPRVIAHLLGRKSTAMKWGQLRAATENIVQTPELLSGLREIGCSDATLETITQRAGRLRELLQDEIQDERLNYIADGYDAEIDELRRLAYHADDLLLQYQQELVRHTGLSNIKLKYVQNQGYLIEVTPKDIAAFEAARNEQDPKFDMVRRQTLKGGERYTTGYLSELEAKILEATQALEYKEAAHLLKIQELLRQDYKAFAELSEAIGEVDLAVNMSIYVHKHTWTRPEFTKDRLVEVREGRHPVIETFLPREQQFVPNDLTMPVEDLVHIVTGPNMGGKSTYLRQQAIIVLLAHAGLYVPASYAKIGLMDGIFARVGSGDMLAQQQSTFMTEMLEMAHILHHATARSFIILDELGRGTSTYDGMALAHAILVYLCRQIQAKCLFATHYHELIALADEYSAIKNFSVRVYETSNEVVFLKKVVPGGASKSYGIDVAKLAGLPSGIIAQAKEYLQEVEQRGGHHMHHHKNNATLPQQMGLDLTSLAPSEIASERTKEQEKYKKAQTFIENIDINRLPPIDALMKLAELKRLLE